MPVAPDPRRTARVLERRGCRGACLAMILGSGFGGVTTWMEQTVRVNYSQLPGFPQTRVPGHAGEAVFGLLMGTPVLILSGRAHYYEGHSLAQVTFPVRVLAELGVDSLLLTNAAGGISRRLRRGDLMALEDHINFIGDNPLRGPESRGQPRFVDLSRCYDPELVARLERAGRHAKVSVKRGIYLAVSGPSFETPAEIRAFARLGADAVGMSTVPEAIVARQCGLRVAGLSGITNLAAGRAKTISHQDVLDQAASLAERAGRVLAGFAKLYAQRNAK